MRWQISYQRRWWTEKCSMTYRLLQRHFAQFYSWTVLCKYPFMVQQIQKENIVGESTTENSIKCTVQIHFRVHTAPYVWTAVLVVYCTRKKTFWKLMGACTASRIVHAVETKGYIHDVSFEIFSNDGQVYIDRWWILEKDFGIKTCQMWNDLKCSGLHVQIASDCSINIKNRYRSVSALVQYQQMDKRAVGNSNNYITFMDRLYLKYCKREEQRKNCSVRKQPFCQHYAYRLIEFT